MDYVKMAHGKIENYSDVQTDRMTAFVTLGYVHKIRKTLC